MSPAIPLGQRFARHPFLLLFLYWLALLPLFALWLARDKAIMPWDMAGHTRSALNLWDGLRQGDFACVYHLSEYYPPLFYILAAPLTMISTHPHTYCAANWLALLVTIWATWRISQALAGTAAGLAAGALVPAYVYVCWMCRQPMLDLLLTATVALTLWLLVRGRRLTEGGQAHALGLALALGLLTKWPYVFFIGLPLLFHGARERLAARREGGLGPFWKGCRWLALWPLVLAGPWYWISVAHIYSKAGRQLSGELANEAGEPLLLSLESLTAYARDLEHLYLRLPLLVLLLAGLVSLIWLGLRGRLRETRVRQGWTILALTLGSGYSCMTMIAHKDPRYIMPVVPVLAVASVHWVGWLKRRWAVVAVTGLIGLSTAMVYWNLFIKFKPQHGEMGVEAAAEWIVRNTADPGRRVRVLVIPNEWTLNPPAVDYALYRRDHHYGAKAAARPLDQLSLGDYRYILLTDPAGSNERQSPYQLAKTHAVLKLSEWRACASFMRWDKRKVVILKRV